MIDPHAQRLLSRLRISRSAGAPAPGIEARREGLRQLLQLGAPRLAPVSATDTVAPGPGGGLHLRLYTPGDAPPVGPGLIYFHGGGLIAGSLDSHDAIARSLALAAACRVIAIDYRLAPEHPFPAAIDDGCAGADWIVRRAEEFGLMAGRIGICGDSAGATLATAVCSDRALRGQSSVALLLLLCPITDYAGESPSRRAFSTGYLIERQTLSEDLALYLPAGDDASDPRISPLRAPSPRGFARAHIHTAEYDPMRDEGAAFAEHLQQAGIPTTYRCHEGMIHLFYGLGGLIPSVEASWRSIGASVRAQL